MRVYIYIPQTFTRAIEHMQLERIRNITFIKVLSQPLIHNQTGYSTHSPIIFNQKQKCPYVHPPLHIGKHRTGATIYHSCPNKFTFPACENNTSKLLSIVKWIVIWILNKHGWGYDKLYFLARNFKQTRKCERLWAGGYDDPCRHDPRKYLEYS